jgi:Putative lipoprotein LpqV
VRWCRHRPLLWVTVVVVTGSVTLVGCSHSAVGGKATKATVSAGASTPAPSARPSGSLPPGTIGISPTGVTTKVDVPAESTEEEYFQACHAARVWMDAHPSTGDSLIEPYLAMIQASATGEAGSWNIRWADLSPARQAGVITAAQAAANAGCG